MNSAQRPRWAALLWLVVLLGLSGVLGCDKSVKEATIHGMVKLDGDPVETGTIQFLPVDGKTPSAGVAIKNGYYEAAVPVGKHRIEIRYPKVVGSRKLYDTPDSPMVDETKEQVPEKYNLHSKLVEDIDGKKSEVNFDLKSKD